MESQNYYSIHAVKPSETWLKRTVRAHLNIDMLTTLVWQDIREGPGDQASNRKNTICDTSISALAMFGSKEPSLSAFDNCRWKEPENRHTIHGITTISCDGPMNTLIDQPALANLQALFCPVFWQVLRGKDLEKMAYLDVYYLLSRDGTGLYSSEKISSSYCKDKKSRKGPTLYYQQIHVASFVHPYSKVVIPVFPESIGKINRTYKIDCERNAVKPVPI